MASPSKPSPPAAALLEDEEDYNSSEDEDFDPTAVPLEVASDAPDDDDDDDDDEDDDNDNGNEGEGALTPAPILKKQKRKRRHSESSTDNPTDSGGEGGLIKTRAQRARETAEKPRHDPIAPTTGKTDVDELWRQMNSKPAQRGAKTPTPEPTAGPEPCPESAKKVHDEETVTISRTYKFAGKSHTELKTVPKDSQEARIYLSSLQATVPTPAPADAPARRPPPKKRASIFDAAAAARKPAQPVAQKMNTLEKSRLDWAGFVDKEGIGEELKKHTRGDKAYLDRQAFLGRVEEKRDLVWKEGQKKG